MNYPSVSFLCPTYGRCPHEQHLLEEMLESFQRNRADYPGDCELVVLNDCPDQHLVTAEPGVRIVNTTARYPSLGQKLNALCILARGEVLLPQDDDDISLPWRARLSVERLGGADAYNPRAYYYAPGDTLIHEQNTGYAHNCSAFRKSAWARVGGYPSLTGNQDAAMDALLRLYTRYVEGPPLSPPATFYLYRWGISSLHLSGQPDPHTAWTTHGRRRFPLGTFTLTPHWRRDYTAWAGQSTSPAV